MIGDAVENVHVFYFVLVISGYFTLKYASTHIIVVVIHLVPGFANKKLN